MNIPKKIWILWLQGIEDAPEVVQKCAQTWQLQNPGWEIHILDIHSLYDYFPHDFILETALENAPPPAFSDILRIYLVAAHGGVWVDGTCFCTTPLDSWLPACTKSGFFAYPGHRKDTPISSWFLVSEKEGYIATRLKDATQHYWNTCPQAQVQRKPFYNKLKTLLNRNEATARIWLIPWVLKTIKCRPYFWFHYLFSRLCRNDKHFRKLWEATPTLPIEPTHRLQNYGLLQPMTKNLELFIRSTDTNVHKLNWKLHKLNNYGPNDPIPQGSVLAAILSGILD